MNFSGTKHWIKYWTTRKVDWNQAHTSTWAHPHRFIITAILKQLQWISLLEVGCGGGANLINIAKHIPRRQLGGCDINEEAIEQVKKVVQGAFLKVCPGDDLMMSDKSVDVILTDMTLLYVSPKDIGKYLYEFKRVARNYVMLCELDSKSFWKRLKLRITDGYHAHNYDKLLKKNGYYDIMYYKLTEKDWPGGNPQRDYACIIVARPPKRYYV